MDISILKMNVNAASAAYQIRVAVEEELGTHVSESRDIEKLADLIKVAVTMNMSMNVTNALCAFIDNIDYEQMIFLKFLGADLIEFQKKGISESNLFQQETRILMKKKRESGLSSTADKAQIKIPIKHTK